MLTTNEANLTMQHITVLYITDFLTWPK